MEKTKKILKRYKLFLFLLLINMFLLFLKPELGIKSFQMTQKNIIEMLTVVPPIFILLGLLDVWVERETMIKFMGEKSGILGILIAFLLGSVASGPLYAAFPIAIVLLKKGSKLFNVLIFIGAWSTTKIPLLLFEATSLGSKFMLIRLLLDIIGILFIAFITQKLLNKNDIEDIYKRVENFEENK